MWSKNILVFMAIIGVLLATAMSYPQDQSNPCPPPPNGPRPSGPPPNGMPPPRGGPGGRCGPPPNGSPPPSTTAATTAA